MKNHIKGFARMSFAKQKSGGFTLIELLVVIAIIGLLASVVYASLGSARAKGRIAAAQISLKNIITGWILCSDTSTVILPTEANNGGVGNICTDTTVTASKYGALPAGWSYCDGVDASAVCTGAANSSASPLKLVGKGDSKTVTCTEDGCVMQ